MSDVQKINVGGVICDIKDQIARTKADQASSDVASMSTQISSKLTAPSSAGSAGQVLTTNGSGVQSWTTIQTQDELAKNMSGGDAFSATSTYAKGSYVIYNNRLYQAINTTTAGILPTNTSYWKEATVASINADLTEKTKNDFGDYINISSYTSSFYTFPSDGYLNLQTGTNAGSAVALVYGSTNGSTAIAISANYNGNTHSSLYVRKGMRVKATSITSATMYFQPLR